MELIVRPAAIIIEKEKLLLLKYVYDNYEVYGLPGGGTLRGEKLTDALIRELKEELGLVFLPEKPVIIGEDVNKERLKHTIHVVFTGRVDAGTPVLDKSHTSALDFVYLTIQELPEHNLYPDVGKVLADQHEQGFKECVYVPEIVSRQWF